MSWGFHWRYKNGSPKKIGLWVGGTPYSHKFYIPFINQLWVK